MFNKESGYGRGTATQFGPVSPNGRQFVVGMATLTNLQIAGQIFKFDPWGTLRFFSTIVAAMTGSSGYGVTNKAPITSTISVTVSTTADTLTTVAAHGLSNGDKVILTGTAAPTGTTLGVIYFVVGVTAAAPTVFQVAATRGGSAIDLSGAGTAVKVSAVTSVGDVVYVLPGHIEQVSTATAFNINVSGLSIVGLGSDEARPTIILDTLVGSTITISAPEVMMTNLNIDGTGFDTITSIFTVSAPGFNLLGCKVTGANATNQAALALTTNAVAHRMRIENCRFIGTTDAGMTNAIQLVGGDDIIIKNNYFYGAYTTSLGPINNVTTACLRINIEGNTLINATASSTKVIVLVAGTTGMIRDNRMAILSGTAPITGAGTFVGANYYVAAAGVGPSVLL